MVIVDESPVIESDRTSSSISINYDLFTKSHQTVDRFISWGLVFSSVFTVFLIMFQFVLTTEGKLYLLTKDDYFGEHLVALEKHFWPTLT